MSTATLSDTEVTKKPSPGMAIVAATVGNMLEWYDFTIYAAFATYISAAFFPAKSEVVSLILSFLTFGVGFIARPIGALFLGSYADRHGRRAALSLTILLMALGTGIIAVCPTYEAIGPAAPLLVLLARMIQGFSAGGEIGGAVSVLVENAPASRRAFYAGFQQTAQGGSTFLSGFVSMSIALSLSPAAVAEWGWRLAFLVGLVIAPVGLWIRRTLEEAPIFTESHARAQDEKPAGFVLRHYWRTILLGVFLVTLWTVSQYVTNYMPTFALRELKMSLPNSFFGPFITGLVLMLAPLIGLVADRFSRKKVMIVGALGYIACTYFLFANLIANPTVETLVATQVIFGLCLVIYSAPASAVLAEAFPTHVRATGVSITYSLGVAIFGGFTPAIVTALIHETGQSISISYWLTAAACVSFIAVLLIKDRTGEELT